MIIRQLIFVLFTLCALNIAHASSEEADVQALALQRLQQLQLQEPVAIATNPLAKLPYTNVTLEVKISDYIDPSFSRAFKSCADGQFFPSRAAELVFDIYNTERQRVGDIVLLFFPGGRAHIKAPVLELAAILIGTSNSHHSPTPEDIALRRKGYGKGALETLFALLRKNKLQLPKSTILTLGVERFAGKDWLVDFYSQFGFTAREPSPLSEFIPMTCPMQKLQFPMHKALKTDQASSAGAAATE